MGQILITVSDKVNANKITGGQVGTTCRARLRLPAPRHACAALAGLDRLKGGEGGGAGGLSGPQTGLADRPDLGLAVAALAHLGLLAHVHVRVVLHLVLQVDNLPRLILASLVTFKRVARLGSRSCKGSVDCRANEPLKALEVEVG